MDNTPALVEKYSNAIVTISSEISQDSSTRLAVGSGFITSYKKKLIIVTSAHVVFGLDTKTPATKIICGIYNVNGKIGNNFSYELKIIGVDGFADCAILWIKDEDSYKEIPSYRCHPHFKIGDNLNDPTGIRVINISNPLGKDVGSVVTGNLRDDKYNPPNQELKAGCITTSCPVYPSSSGSCVFDFKGKVVGIISFGFIQEGNVQTAAFAGGTGAHTLNIIIKNIMTGKNVQKIDYYLSNLKGWFGDITYNTVTARFLNLAYPNNFKNLKIRGLILDEIKEESPLSNPIKGKPLKQYDIIVAIWDPSVDKYLEIGPSEDQYPPGIAMWRYNPLKNNIAKLRVIYDPDKNSKVEEISVKLDVIPNPELISTFGRSLADNTDPTFYNINTFQISRALYFRKENWDPLREVGMNFGSDSFTARNVDPTIYPFLNFGLSYWGLTKDFPLSKMIASNYPSYAEADIKIKGYPSPNPHKIKVFFPYIIDPTYISKGDLLEVSLRFPTYSQIDNRDFIYNADVTITDGNNKWSDGVLNAGNKLVTFDTTIPYIKGSTLNMSIIFFNTDSKGTISQITFDTPIIIQDLDK